MWRWSVFGRAPRRPALGTKPARRAVSAGVEAADGSASARRVYFLLPSSDKTILKAMSANEIETKMACDHASKNDVATPEAHTFFQKAYADESGHRDWMDSAAAALRRRRYPPANAGGYLLDGVAP